MVNPVYDYFGPTILSSREYGVNSVQSHDERLEAKHVTGLLRIQETGKNSMGDLVDTKPDWAENLAVIGIKYVILAKEEDWQDYQFLNSAPKLNKIFEDENFIVYQNSLL